MMPQQPGCYLFKDAKGKVIYIGKAKNLKKRVSSYFNRTNLDPKTENLVKNIKSTDFIAVDNEKEALILVQRYFLYKGRHIGLYGTLGRVFLAFSYKF